MTDRLYLLALLPAAALTSFASAQGTSIPSVVVHVENVQPARGAFLTPPWLGIHDGTFDTYDGGQPASVPLGGNEVEALAEDGNTGPLTAAFDALQPGRPQVAALPSPTGPYAPGQRASVTFNVDPTIDRYFSYASMIIPSNDAFVANGNPLAHPLFDANGQFVGESFIVSGDESNDAGTEVNDEIPSNVAFYAQAAPNTGTDEGGTVTTPSPGLAAPGTLAFPNGVLNLPFFANADFNDADDRLLSVRFQYVDLGGRVSFSGRLSGAQEVQPDAAPESSNGIAIAESRNGNRLFVSVLARELTGPIQAAHLHLGAAGTNGPVIVDLTPGVNGSGVMVRARVRDGDLTGPLAGASFVEFLNEVAAGNVYVNLHTAQFPAGEIRGQLEL